MSKTLELVFKSNLNKPVKLLLPDFNAITTEQLIKESMYGYRQRIRYEKHRR